MKGKFEYNGDSWEFEGFTSINQLVAFNGVHHFFSFAVANYKIGVKDYWVDSEDGGRTHVNLVPDKMSMDYSFPDVMSSCVSQIFQSMTPKYYVDGGYEITVDIDLFAMSGSVKTTDEAITDCRV